MRIAYCVPAIYASGGMERVLSIKANYLADVLNYDVHIIVTDGEAKSSFYPLSPLVKICQLGINFEEMYCYPLYRRLWIYKKKMTCFKRKLNEALLSIRPDITISLLRRDINIMDRMTDGSIKIGEIHFNRDSYRSLPPNPLPAFVNRYIQYLWMALLICKLKKLDQFIVLTNEDAENWKELNNVQVIPNPISFLSEATSDCKNKQVMAAGRYVGQKGFDMLISAWKIVAEKHPGWVLKIFGDGWMRECLQKQIEENDLKNCCYLEYSVVNIAEKYQESSIFVLSSRYEGFGLVLVEAMGCGVPVISFACPCGPKDIITEGVDGFLVASGNIGELANKISYLIEHDNVRQQMGFEAVRKARYYGIEIIGMQWKDLFEKLILKG